MSEAVRERPILFSGPMVRAILDGCKTQTRRVVRPQPGKEITDWSHDVEEGKRYVYRGDVVRLAESRGRNKRDAGELTPHVVGCRYGNSGDRLWVRETWAQGSGHRVAYRADGVCGAWCDNGDGGFLFLPHGYMLEACTDKGPSFGLGAYGGRWRPSIHMPRWACRLRLEVTAVRAERLQEISVAERLRTFF